MGLVQNDTGLTATIDRMMTEFLRAHPVHNHPIGRHTGCKFAIVVRIEASRFVLVIATVVFCLCREPDSEQK
jgi:hypothetical protein